MGKKRKTDKLTPSTKHNRTLNFRLDNGETLEITVMYTGPSSGYNGAILDGEVIPYITKAANAYRRRIYPAPTAS